MKTIFSFFATTLFAANAFTQSSAELTCRAQAKDLAMQTYSSCMTQARNNQVEEIRKNYQKELTALKTKYDSKLKTLSGGKADKKTAQSKTQGKELTQNKVPTTVLPQKNLTPEAKEAPYVADSAKVIAVDTEQNSENPYNEPSSTDQVEVIDMPVE